MTLPAPRCRQLHKCHRSAALSLRWMHPQVVFRQDSLHFRKVIGKVWLRHTACDNSVTTLCCRSEKKVSHAVLASLQVYFFFRISWFSAPHNFACKTFPTSKGNPRKQHLFGGWRNGGVCRYDVREKERRFSFKNYKLWLLLAPTSQVA